MLNKEEIEKYESSLIKVFLSDIKRKENDLIYQTSMENAKYIEQLENKIKEQEKELTNSINKDKVREYVEDKMTIIDNLYNEMLTDIGGIKVINTTGLSKKEKDEIINKRNCLLVQKATLKDVADKF